jgi:hypothetical protein
MNDLNYSWFCVLDIPQCVLPGIKHGFPQHLKKNNTLEIPEPQDAFRLAAGIPAASSATSSA